MSFTHDFADGLAQEALVEMADNFFGARKSLDDEKELFEEQVAQVNLIGDAALTKAALLHALLLDEQVVQDFYSTLEVKTNGLAGWVHPEKAELFIKAPFSLFDSRRYAKLVYKVYEEVAEAFDTYLHGRYYSEPLQGGRKRLSPHYHLLKDWSGHINRRIRNVNEGLAPSCVLGFAKGLECGQLDKERLSGATLEGYACTLDTELAIPTVDCLELGLKELPELPSSTHSSSKINVKETIYTFTKTIYKQHKDRIHAVLNQLTPK